MDNSCFAKGDVIELEEYICDRNMLNVVIARDERGNLIIRDLITFPHIMICGYTGSGKTSFLSTLISEIITEYDPQMARFIIIDTKNVDYNVFNRSMHMLLPVINPGGKITEVLKWLVAECDRRLSFLASYGLKTSKDFNVRIKGNSRISDIFVVIDDYASLSVSRENEQSIMKIIRDGRIVGIHMIIVSSTSDSDAVPPAVLSGISHRICFRVATPRESNRLLGLSGAESLAIPGELYCSFNGSIYKGYGVYSTADNIRSVMESINRPDISIKALKAGVENVFSDLKQKSTLDEKDYDAYFADACRFVVEKQKASASMIQRVFKVGYNRAARMIDQMEAAGVVGPEEGINPRRVLMDRNSIEVFLGKI